MSDRRHCTAPPPSMAGKQLRQMPLPPHLLHVFHARNLHTAKDVLTRTELELVELVGEVAAPELRRAVSIICRAVAPRCRTLREVLREEDPAAGAAGARLGTPLRGLDAALGGGIPRGVVTEVAAAAGMGKTQLCLTLAAMVATAEENQEDDQSLGQGELPPPPPPPPRVVYLDSERAVREKRLRQIAHARSAAAGRPPLPPAELAARIAVERPGTAAELTARLQSLLLQPPPPAALRLLVVDGVAALVQDEYGLDRMAERQRVLGQVASLLKAVAERLRVPVVVTNQVRMQRAGQGDVPSFADDGLATDGGADGGGADAAADMRVAPALGTRWAHAVNIRLVMEWQAGQRCVAIAKCPYAPLMRFPYAITSAGVQDPLPLA